MTLADLALSRSSLDRVSDDRHAPGTLAAALDDPDTLVLPVRGGRAPVTPERDRLVLRARGEVELDVPALLAAADPAGSSIAVLLGRHGPARVVALLLSPQAPLPLPDLPDEGSWLGIREVGSSLDDLGVGALTEAVALEHWHRTHPRCPRCGSATVVAAAGHERRCPVDGSTHHPRYDPAVIMTVVGPGDRLLLGRQERWPPGRFSCFAGFVEPGESLERAVARELLEEAGIRATSVTYLGSQPWPFPASLMLGFCASTADTQAVPDGREIVETRWLGRQELAALLADGSLGLPPRVSIARRLIEHWYGGVLPDHPRSTPLR